MRRRLAWGLAVPLALAGTEAAHAFAYALVYPQARIRGLALVATGHGYLAWLPVALGVAAGAAVLTLAAAAVDAARGRSADEAPPWAFALLPPAAFAVQEILELSLHTGTLGWRAVLAPTFAPGLLLQLPFALAAYLVARLLVRAARAIGCAFLRRPVLRHTPCFAASHAAELLGRSVAPALARGPPLVVGI
jgi:hypothetical protein